MCDEDDSLDSTRSNFIETKNVTSKTNTTKKVEKKESIKLETPTDSKKKMHIRNGKLGIDKRFNYAYVPNTRRKLCQN